MNMRKRQGRVTEKQHEIFLDFMSARPEFVQAKFNSYFTKSMSESLWKELTRKLNSNGVGPAKDIDKWKKTWTDWKCLVKAKAARIQRNSTPDSVLPKESLTPLEERLLSVVEWLNPTPMDGEINVVSDEEDSEYQPDSGENHQELVIKTSINPEEFVVLENNDPDLEESSDSTTGSVVVASDGEGTSENFKRIEEVCQQALLYNARPMALGSTFSINGIKRSNSSENLSTQIGRLTTLVEENTSTGSYISFRPKGNNNANFKKRKGNTIEEDDVFNGVDYNRDGGHRDLEREKVTAMDGIKDALHRIANAEESKVSVYRDLVIAEQAKATALQNLVSMAFNYLNKPK